MPRYDKVFLNLAARAAKQGALDATAFASAATDAGMSAASLQARLLNDLNTGGPIFGKFVRSLTGAAETATMEAFRQGQRGGEVEASKRLQRLLRLSKAEGSLLTQALDKADPSALADVEKSTSTVVQYMWVAELVNTCHRCLPLHGSVMTGDEWTASGLHPSTIHDGWTSPCHCNLVPQERVGDKREERRREVAPLTRTKLKTATGLKGERKTARAVGQANVDRSRKARDTALETLEGRRTMRLLGQAKGDLVQ